MSDLSELFGQKSDPKHLDLGTFVEKELNIAETATAKLPAELQGFATSVQTTAANLETAVTSLSGTPLGQVLTTELPTVEQWFAGLLAKTGAVASTASGMTSIGQITAAVTSVIQHLGAQASIGTPSA
jgi:hypothetical protein